MESNWEGLDSAGSTLGKRIKRTVETIWALCHENVCQRHYKWRDWTAGLKYLDFPYERNKIESILRLAEFALSSTVTLEPVKKGSLLIFSNKNIRVYKEVY